MAEDRKYNDKLRTILGNTGEVDCGKPEKEYGYFLNR